LNSATTEQRGSGFHQEEDINSSFGAGFSSNDARFIDAVATAVTKKLTNQQNPSVNQFTKYYERSEPTVVIESVPNTTPPLNFSVPLENTDLNDSFDERRLLQDIPKRSKKNASMLLKVFDERPNEITWDSSGNIYINEAVIPNANIFKLFPFLFRKKNPKNLPGMLDFVNKLQAMGLSHLISCNLKTNTPTLEHDRVKPSSSDKWWFLGE
jgi:hypothetical protein